MKILKLSPIILLVCLCSPVFSQDPDYRSISEKIVNTTLKVQPGESVFISGSSDELDLMEELYVTVSKAGGKPILGIDIPTAQKRAVMETSNDYLSSPNKFGLTMMKEVDCFINVNSVENPDLFKDVPEEKLAAFRQSFQAFNEVYPSADFRSVSLGQVGGIPTQAYAKSIGADYTQLKTMFWEAVDTDYKALLAKGKKIAASMKNGSSAHLKSTAGTDITFTIGNTDARTNCGRSEETADKSGPSESWLPAGEVYITIDPTSANGTLVVPYLDFRDHDISNLKLTFKNGTISSMEADENIQVLEKALNLSTGIKNALSYLDIGLNPDSHPLEGSDYLSFEMGGVITVGVGSNLWAGGGVVSDFGVSFHLPNSTLAIDGQEIVVNGSLK